MSIAILVATCVEREADGKARSEADARRIRLVVSKDHRFSYFEGDAKVAEGRLLAPDPKGPALAVDRTIAGRSEFSGRFEPVHRQRGLIRTEGDRLMSVFARDPADPRPATLSAPTNKGLVREVFRKVR